MKERRTYSVVDSPIQLRLLAVVTGLFLVVALLGGSYVWYLLETINSVSSGQLEFTPALYSTLYYKGLVTLFSLIFTVFVGLFLIIRESHRVVGPLFRLKDELRQMRSTGKIRMLTIRDRDRIHGFVRELNQLLKSASLKSDADGG